jgi:hypothetical protein
MRVEDDEVAPGPLQVVAERESGLPTADDDGIHRLRRLDGRCSAVLRDGIHLST